MTPLVLIAGAGPVGLTLAMALKRRGVDVRIVEKAAARTDKSKALVLWARTLELLDIEGWAQPFVDAGLTARGARVMAHGHVLGHIRLDVAPSVYHYALMLPQSDTERLLEERLAQLGVTVERQVELVSFVDDGNDSAAGIHAVLRRADGREETVNAAWLTGCDGAHSTVRHALGVSFDGRTLPSDWVLADVQIDGDLPHDELTISSTPEGVLALFPIRGSRFRVIADIAPPAAGPDAPAPTLAEIQPLLERRGSPGLRAHSPVWLSRFHINERKVRDYRHGRVFLLGDAAHVHSPAGGQGMNTGMQDAFNLAWKLALVCRGQATAALLDSYSTERSAIGDRVLRNAGRMTRLMTLRNPLLQELRSIAVGAASHIAAIQRRMAAQMTEVNLHYRDGPLTGGTAHPSSHPAPGERARDVALSSVVGGATRLHELLAHGRFVVLSVGATELHLPGALPSVATRADVDAAAAEALGYEAGFTYLIRPDAYVATSTRHGDLSWVGEALSRMGVDASGPSS